MPRYDNTGLNFHFSMKRVEHLLLWRKFNCLSGMLQGKLELNWKQKNLLKETKQNIS